MGEHKHNPAALAAKMGMLPPKRVPDTPIPINVNIGHDGKQLVVSYSQRLEFITYTPEQARAHIDSLEGCLAHLLEHQAQAKLNTLTVVEGDAGNQIEEIKA